VSSGPRARPRPALASLPYPTGLSIGIGAATVVASTMLAATIPATDAGWRFAVVAVTFGVFAALVPDRSAVAWTGGLAWLLVNGFLVDSFGELSWHGRSDLYRALMLVAVAAAGLAIGQGVRLWSVWRGYRRFDDEWRTVVRLSTSSVNFEEETRDA
jgi:hypothetical protein